MVQQHHSVATMDVMLDDRARHQAGVLRDLHRPGDPLVLANVWDAAGARRVAAAGFPVVATSSAAVAESLGHADHEQMPATGALGMVRRLAGAVDLPISADMEAGYGLAADDLVTGLLEAGAAGCNLEDTDHGTGRRVPLAAQCERIASVAAAARSRRFSLVVNARIDTWLHPVDNVAAAIEDTIDRGRAYLAAGAACVYPIALRDHSLIATVVREIPGPVNVLDTTGTATALGTLACLGVARISTGPYLWRLTLAHLEQQLAALRPPGRGNPAGAGSQSAGTKAGQP